jgi:fatty-acyl-CoA synthase
LEPKGNLPVSVAASATLEERLDLQQLQGRRVHGVELKIVNEDGVPQPHDGEAVGELYVRGNNVISGYFNNEEATADAMDARWVVRNGRYRVDQCRMDI